MSKRNAPRSSPRGRLLRLTRRPALTALIGALLGALPVNPLEAQAAPDEELVGYDALVEYLSQPRVRSRSLGGVVPADPLRITVTFDFDRADLTSLGRRQLDLLADALKAPQVGNRRIEIAGHCDERGTEPYNLRLSERRVENAVHYLWDEHRIAPGRVLGLGYGESQPKIPNARTEPEHAANRRVEIRLLSGPESGIVQTRPGPSPTTRRGVEPDVIGEAGDRLAVQWGVFRTNGGSMQLIAHDGTASLRSGDEYRVYVRPETASYLYVYQLDSVGDGSWLFPRPDSLIDNPLSSSDFWIPAPNRSFRLAPLAGGEPIDETIYLVASAEPIPELERLLGDPDAEPAAVIGKFRTRGQRVVPRPRPEGGELGDALARVESAAGSKRLRHEIRFGHER